MIKLCYKEYDFKVTNKACKNFYELTGLDLQNVFMTYIVECAKTKGSGFGVMERVVHYGNLYTREVACKALHCIIKEEMKEVSLSEIEDATFRVSWANNGNDGDLSEPWPLVMLTTALQINEYFTKGLNIKKQDTSG